MKEMINFIYIAFFLKSNNVLLGNIRLKKKLAWAKLLCFGPAVVTQAVTD